MSDTKNSIVINRIKVQIDDDEMLNIAHQIEAITDVLNDTKSIHKKDMKQHKKFLNDTLMLWIKCKELE